MNVPQMLIISLLILTNRKISQKIQRFFPPLCIHLHGDFDIQGENSILTIPFNPIAISVTENFQTFYIFYPSLCPLQTIKTSCINHRLYEPFGRNELI